MFTKHKTYYVIEQKEENNFIFICSYSSYSEAKLKLDDLVSTNGKEYRVLKIEKDIEEVD